MAWSRDVALAAASALEVIAALAAVRGDGALALSLHVASCLGLALGLRRRLLEGKAGAALTFTLSLFLPVLGAAGLLAAARMTPPTPCGRDPDLVRTRVPGSAEAPAAAPPVPSVRGGSALTRVGTARDRRDPGAVTLLRRSLAHPEEDVRLIAFSVLESKSRAAYRDVHEATRELERAPGEHRGAFRRRLAARQWEIVRLGLAEGECLAHALDQALRHTLAALDGDPGQASLHLLLGRIRLRRGEAREAETALSRAVALGLPAEIAQPYLAEAAFLARRFELVRRRLSCAPSGGSPAVERVRRFWS